MTLAHDMRCRHNLYGGAARSSPGWPTGRARERSGHDRVASRLDCHTASTGGRWQLAAGSKDRWALSASSLRSAGWVACMSAVESVDEPGWEPPRVAASARTNRGRGLSHSKFIASKTRDATVHYTRSATRVGDGKKCVCCPIRRLSTLDLPSRPLNPRWAAKRLGLIYLCNAFSEQWATHSSRCCWRSPPLAPVAEWSLRYMEAGVLLLRGHLPFTQRRRLAPLAQLTASP